MRLTGCFIFSIVILLCAVSLCTGGNYQKWGNGLFELKLDKVTSGYYLSVRDKPFLSIGYPPSSFVLITIGNKDYFLYRDAGRDNDALTGSGVNTFFRLEGLYINQIMDLQQDSLTVEYRIRNRNNQARTIGCCAVLDIAQPVKNFSFTSNSFELALGWKERSVMLEIPPQAGILFKPGDYQAFKSSFWKSRKETNKKMNSLAVYFGKRKVLSGEVVSLKYNISLGQQTGIKEVKRGMEPDKMLEPVKKAVIPIPAEAIDPDPLDDFLKEENTPKTNEH
ncbi:MAG: hypothetical protein PHF84_01045 [bacterium]|nr:hypothetical protein [bacterium]